ncbi:MAG TPA: formimidoylglutamase [Usitatibacteraceae bacterium]
MSMHTPPDMSLWQGRVDSEEGPLARRWHDRVQPLQSGAAKGIVLLGFACDEGVGRNQGRTGAREGPLAIRRALANLAWHHDGPVYDGGDVYCEGHDLEGAQTELARQLGHALDAGHFPLVFGGGHEVAFGSFMGLARHAESKKQNPRIGIVNFDAHFDLRAGSRGNSGTPFRQIADACIARGTSFSYLVFGISELANTDALFHRARELGVQWRTDEECARESPANLRDTLLQFADKVDWLYLTVCLDALPAGVAPGVSAPAAFGIELKVVEALIDAAKTTRKLKLADIAELSPAFDPDGRTARVAARVAWRVTR